MDLYTQSVCIDSLSVSLLAPGGQHHGLMLVGTGFKLCVPVSSSAVLVVNAVSVTVDDPGGFDCWVGILAGGAVAVFEVEIGTAALIVAVDDPVVFPPLEGALVGGISAWLVTKVVSTESGDVFNVNVPVVIFRGTVVCAPLSVAFEVSEVVAGEGMLSVTTAVGDSVGRTPVGGG